MPIGARPSTGRRRGERDSDRIIRSCVAYSARLRSPSSSRNACPRRLRRPVFHSPASALRRSRNDRERSSHEPPMPSQVPRRPHGTALADQRNSWVRGHAVISILAAHTKSGETRRAHAGTKIDEITRRRHRGAGRGCFCVGVRGKRSEPRERKPVRGRRGMQRFGVRRRFGVRAFRRVRRRGYHLRRCERGRHGGRRRHGRNGLRCRRESWQRGRRERCRRGLQGALVRRRIELHGAQLRGGCHLHGA